MKCLWLKGQLAFSVGLVLCTQCSYCNNNETKLPNNANYKWLQDHPWRRQCVLCIKHPWSVWTKKNARFILNAEPMQYLSCQGKVPNQIQEKTLFQFSFTSIPFDSRNSHLRNIYRPRPSVTTSSAIPTNHWINFRWSRTLQRGLPQEPPSSTTAALSSFQLTFTSTPRSFKLLQPSSPQHRRAEMFCSTALELTSSSVLYDGNFCLLCCLSGYFRF